ncbi:O-antigen polymerase [Pediococcus pentosaceus]|uniref:O-antigen polymerase n=1 Tax=Pediococcus pentosaceus TaxID=1255 RepID=UPI002016C66B|nr:oligosaccharide repeat unit polymerase [Pediococcus pentosaceus]
MILIFVSLIFIIIFAYTSSNYDVMAPSVLFTFSFLLSSGWALMYVNKWSLNPSIGTILVIVMGTLEFVLISYGINKIVKNNFEKNKGLVWLNVNTTKTLIIISIEIFIILYVIKSIKDITGVSELSDAIYTYRRVNLFSTKSFLLPKSVFIGNYFCNSVGFFYGYLLVKKIIMYKKLDFLMLIAIILSAYESTLFGSRTGLFVLGLAIVTYFYCLKRISEGKNLKIKLKSYVIGITLISVFLGTFKQLAVLLGRDVYVSSFDYLATYIGAEIKNLDSFIRANNFPITSDIFHSQTVDYISKYFGRIFGKGGLDYKLDLPFQSINGFDLGNVYTMFYQFMYDLGYVGVFLFTLLMAVIVQTIYSRVKLYKDNGKVSYSILLYGYIANTLVLAFFSNKFYEQVGNSSFVFVVLFWWILNLFVFTNPIKFRNKNGE